MDPEAAVRKRYSGAAQEREAALCCPVDYDAKYLQAIPSEVIERDYGCGDAAARGKFALSPHRSLGQRDALSAWI